MRDPSITGHNLIAGEWSSAGQQTFTSVNPRTKTAGDTAFYNATPAEIDRAVTAAADAFLDTITQDMLLTHLDNREGGQSRENVGTMLHRNIYHYWFHTGEAHAALDAQVRRLVQLP